MLVAAEIRPRLKILDKGVILRERKVRKNSGEEDVHAHCYCASLLRTLFIRHARTTSYIKHAHRSE